MGNVNKSLNMTTVDINEQNIECSNNERKDTFGEAVDTKVKLLDYKVAVGNESDIFIFLILIT